MKMGATRTPSIRTMLGADARRSVDLGTKGKLDVTLRAGWAHELKNGAQGVDLAFAAVPTAAFRAEGIAAQKDSALIGLGLGTALSGNVSGFVCYDGDLGRKGQINTVSAGLRFGW
jgi:outer membrane autotransporter protein